jgi:hypothetical protein
MSDLGEYYGFSLDSPVLAFQFVCGADLSSRLIAWYGNGYGGYSHVDEIVTSQVANRLAPIGSLIGARSDRIGKIPPGVQVRPPRYETCIRRCVAVLNCTENEELAAEHFISTQLGRQYDKPAILGFILGKPLHGRGHWICSALQTQRLRVAGLIDRLPDPDSQITPNSLLLILAAIGARIHVLPP